MYHYVYRITNTEEDKHYYGSRKSNRRPKDDLGIYYFSSSRDKAFIQSQKERPEIFKYVIVKIFDNHKEALEYECKLHERLDVGRNQKFYNKAKQTSSGFSMAGISVTDEKKIIVSKTFKNKKQTKEHIKSRTSKIKGDRNGMYGTYYYEKWINLYGKEKADEMYEDSLNKRVRGKNNPCYNKIGKDHPASKKYVLEGNGIYKVFNSTAEIIRECENLGISWNTLRQYSKKNKKLKGYMITASLYKTF